MKDMQEKIRFFGRIVSVQPRANVWRYRLDNRSHGMKEAAGKAALSLRWWNIWNCLDEAVSKARLCRLLPGRGFEKDKAGWFCRWRKDFSMGGWSSILRCLQLARMPHAGRPEMERQMLHLQMGLHGKCYHWIRLGRFPEIKVRELLLWPEKLQAVCHGAPQTCPL